MALATQAGTRTLLSGFGRTRPTYAAVTGPVSPGGLAELLATRPPTGLIARGSGLSYGDAAQNAGGLVLSPVTEPAVELDRDRATVTASASTTFAEILTRIVPAGFCLPVLPGTRHVTVGGAIAADVHGKNHRQAGSLARWAERIDLVDGLGELRSLTPAADRDALLATTGGMGLTGVILAATLRLRRIDSDLIEATSRRAASLEVTLAMMASAGAEYTVAWVDATASGSALGRGIVETADHAPAGAMAHGDRLSYRQRRPAKIPSFRVSMVTPSTARTFNSLWFRKAPRRHTGVADFATFFHRLDAVAGWNQVTGPHGLIQYQFVVPDGAENVLATVLNTVQRNRCAPFLGTLKRFGAASGGPLSFPVPGWCLALDMPAGHNALPTVLADLDMRVAAAGGRVYLAKDARLRQDAFDAMYGPLSAWRATRARLDPHRLFQSDLARRVGLC
jgi:decaprenylphospho-beta-D-ribofuranose 2-oxidase